MDMLAFVYMLHENEGKKSLCQSCESKLPAPTFTHHFIPSCNRFSWKTTALFQWKENSLYSNSMGVLSKKSYIFISMLNTFPQVFTTSLDIQYLPHAMYVLWNRVSSSSMMTYLEGMVLHLYHNLHILLSFHAGMLYLRRILVIVSDAYGTTVNRTLLSSFRACRSQKFSWC